MTGFALEDPLLLGLALLIPAALWWRGRQPRRSILFAPAMILGPGLPGTWRTRLGALPTICKITALLLMVIALSRPREREPLPLEKKGLDIFLCLDVSSSMTAHDLDTRRNRLDVARQAALDFIAGRPEDRFGLVSFARYPDLLSPLTLDHDALALLLKELTPVVSDGPEDATGIGTALARAARGFSRSEPGSQVVVLFTDGEENVASTATPEEIAPLHAAQLFERLGVRVHAIAAGAGRRGPDGQWVPLDTRQVREVARRTGGTFHEARDAQAVRAVYAAIHDMERVPFEDPRFRWIDRFFPFLLAGLGLWTAGHLLGRLWLEPSP